MSFVGLIRELYMGDRCCSDSGVENAQLPIAEGCSVA